MAVLRTLRQQVSVLAHINGGSRNDLLADRIDRRIGHLCEQLLKVIEQRLIFLGQNRDGCVDSHCTNLLRTGQRHGADLVSVILVGIAESLLKSGKFFLLNGRNLLIGDLDVCQRPQIAVQPFAVRLSACIDILQFLIQNHFPLLCVYQKHLSGMESLLSKDMCLIQLQNSNLGSQNQSSVIHQNISGGTQSVAVQNRPHHISVREHNGCRTIPRLHHGSIILVEISLFLRDGIVVLPGLRNQNHGCKCRIHSSHDQKFQCIIQHCRIRTGKRDDRKNLRQILLCKASGLQCLFSCQHLIHIALDSVDLTVVHHKTVGMCTHPAGVGVG